MIRQNNMCRVADEEPLFQVDIDEFFNLFDLFNQGGRVYHNTISDNAFRISVKHTGWNEMENNRFVVKL